MTNGSLMQVKSISQCSKGSNLQYFWPALSDNWSSKPIFDLFESGGFTQVLLYLVRSCCGVVDKPLTLSQVWSRLLQSVGCKFKPWPRLHMTLAVYGKLNKTHIHTHTHTLPCETSFSDIENIWPCALGLWWPTLEIRWIVIIYVLFNSSSLLI